MQVKAFADAARMAYKLKQFPVAAQYFDEAGMPFEAAACFAEAGDKRRCLDAVVRVPREHPKYRVAAAQAIRVSTELGALDFKLDHFVGPFIADGPKDDREADALYALAKLYRARDFLENAREIYEKIAAARPGYKDVADQLAKLAREAKGSRMAYENVVREDAAFHGDARAGRASKAEPVQPVGAVPAKAGRLLPRPPGSAAPPAAAPAPLQKTGYGSRAPVGALPCRRCSPPDERGGDPARRAAGRAADRRLCGAGRASPLHPPRSSRRTELAIGATIAERYRIDAKIGQGGMAAVYRAMDLELGEDIAIKLFVQPSDDPQLLARFKQELTLSRGLAHPNIVRLYDIGQHQGCRFLTMELLQGTDLGALIDGRPLEIARGLRYLIQAAAGMGLAHDKGVIHRDVKPANFFITKDDTLKVMDFGIAKRTTQQSGMTQAGFIAGTPSYMSPEQINNFSAVSHLTDIYALGIVAYEVFTGSVPFDHSEMMQLLMMHLTRAPEPPRERNPAIPPELEAIILKLIEKEPANRIQSCHEARGPVESVAPSRVRGQHPRGV